MRYRRLSSDGDYTFGQGSANFLVNSPECVAQAVKTRLLLWQGEWFLDKTSGTPWSQSILGIRTNPTYDLVIQNRVLETKGVISIDEYESFLDGKTRHVSVNMLITTTFGQTRVQT